MSNKYTKMLAFKLGIIFTTQPIQVVMRVQQNSLKEGRVFSIVKGFTHVVSQGQTPLSQLGRLWSGTLPALGKEGFKYSTYKTPILSKTPDFFASTFSNSWTQSLSNETQHLTNSVGAAASASAVDTCLGGAFDRIAAFYALKQGDQANASFLKEMKSHGSLWNQFLFLNKGFIPTFTKTFLNLSVMYSVRGPLDQLLYQQHQLKPGDAIPTNVDLMGALGTGSLAALISAPFDAIKAMAQAPGSKDTPLLRTLHSNIKHHGIVGSFAGLPLKVVLAAIGWSATTLVLDKKSHVPEGDGFRRFK